MSFTYGDLRSRKRCRCVYGFLRKKVYASDSNEAIQKGSYTALLSLFHFQCEVG